MDDNTDPREIFITRQLEALRDLGLSPAVLLREEKALRAGAAARSFMQLFREMGRERY